MLTTYAFVFLHTTLLSLAGLLLWRLWRHVAAAADRRAMIIVAAGFIARAAVAQVLFWISYLRLPVAESLQDGDGFWSLAIDGRSYFAESQRILQQGWQSIVLVNKALPSPVFLQVLAVFIFLFGAVASIGALLNLFAYLGSCAAILRLGRRRDGIAQPALFALAALSFAPSVVLWSVQPLKDAFFMFAIVGFVAACSLWQEAWLAGGSRLLRFLLPLLLLLTALYTVVGIRWYCGLLLWGASLPFFVFTTMRSSRRTVAGVVNAGVFVAMSQVLMFGGGPYFAPAIATLLGHPSRRTRLESVPSDVARVVATSRRGFEESPANTQIQLGRVLAEADHLAMRSSPHPDRGPKDLAQARSQQTDEVVRPHEDAPERARAAMDARPSPGGMASAAGPNAGVEDAASPPAAPTRSAPATSSAPEAAAPDASSVPPKPLQSPVATPSSFAVAAARNDPPPSAPAPTPAPSPASKTPAPAPTSTSKTAAPAPASKTAAPAPASKTPTPAPKAAASVAEHSAKRHEDPAGTAARGEVSTKKSEAVVRQRPSRPAVRETVAKTEPVAVPRAQTAVQPIAKVAVEPVDKSSPALIMPESAAGRLAAGATALVLPRFIGEAAGLIHVGGGRGLWAIVELDTLIFDVLLFIALYYVVRAIVAGGALRNPSFWLVLLMTAGIAALLAYTISNFGTLFRHRAMILVGLCLLLVVARDAGTSPMAEPECP